MAELYLIVRLAGERIALRAAEVEAVVEIEALTPVPGAAPHIAGLAALRSRVLTVVDGLAAVDPSRSLAGSAHEAVMAVVDGHPYALLVEAVEDVVEGEGGHAPAGTLRDPWRHVGSSIVEAEGDLFLLADFEAFLAGPAREAA